MKFPRAMYSLRMSFWVVPRSLLGLDALLLADQLVEQQQHRGGRVDRHRGRDLVERDAVEGGPHVVERVDRDAGAPDLAEAARVVGVEAELGRQVEGHRQALGPVGEQVLVALVGLLRRRVARVLAHRPQLLAVHLAVRPARERELAGLAEALLEVLGHVAGLVERLDLDAGVREAPRVVGSDDRRHGEVGRFLEVLVVDGHAVGGFARRCGRGRGQERGASELPPPRPPTSRRRRPLTRHRAHPHRVAFATWTASATFPPSTGSPPSSTRRTRIAVLAARAVIDERRAELRGGATGEVDLLARAQERVARIERRSPRPVLNATGVIVHTNLGRAPLAADAQAAVARIAAGYSNLEWDVESGGAARATTTSRGCCAS